MPDRILQPRLLTLRTKDDGTAEVKRRCTLKGFKDTDVLDLVRDHSRDAEVFGAHAAPQGMCDNMVNALKLLANQQKDGDSPAEMVVPDLLDKSRLKTMDGLGMSVAVDKYAAVKIWDPEKKTKSARVVSQKCTTNFPGVVVREGADELPLRAHEEGHLRSFIDTTNVGDKKRWELPLVDEDWHAICWAVYNGVEGPEWQAMYQQCEELHQAVKSTTCD